MKNENFEHCKGIARDLERVTNGEIYRCPLCGGYVHLPDGLEEDEARCPDCERFSASDKWEMVSLSEWLEDGIYDTEYTVDSRKEYRAVRIMVACGGPNIYINTRSGDVELYWWTESARYAMTRDVIDAIDELFEELYNC